MFLLFLYLFIALFFSFLCSIMEAVVLSIPPSFIVLRIEEKSKLTPDLKRIQKDIDKPLSAILTLNTFAHTLGAAGVGAQAQLIWGKEYLSLISGLLTVLILVVSEIIPKTLGASYWKELTPFTMRILRVLIVVLYPFIIISQLITNSLKRKRVNSVFSRGDLQTMAEMVKKEGEIEQDESNIIKNLMRFKNLKVKDIKTPRTVLHTEDENTTIGEIGKRIDDIPFSRIPLYHENMDEITGFVLKDDILREMAYDNNQKKLQNVKRDIEMVFEDFTVLSLLDFLIKNQSHIALVVDEYGGNEGVVTMEDLMETLLGLEIIDETDDAENMKKLARDKWYKRMQKTGLRPADFLDEKQQDQDQATINKSSQEKSDQSEQNNQDEQQKNE